MLKKHHGHGMMVARVVLLLVGGRWGAGCGEHIAHGAQGDRKEQSGNMTAQARDEHIGLKAAWLGLPKQMICNDMK